jgi:REP element-mobilizing transposase RayT
MVYLITVVTYRRETVFADPDNAHVAHEDIAFYAAKFKAESLAHVIMPDHVHWVIRPSPEDFERFAREQQEKGGQYAKSPHRYYLGKILQDYQRHVAYVINKRRGTRGVKVWQDGFRDDMLRGEEAVFAAVRYVIYNPVEAGLVERPENYAYWDSVYRNAPE